MIQKAICMKKIIEGKFFYKSLSQLLNDITKYSFAVLKGEPLSIMAHQKNGMRFYNDIDIMPLAQRFTIAHEIKHVVCGDCFQKTLTEEDEVLAEHFARSLLAPQCMVIYQNEKDKNSISKHYEISLPSAENCYNAVENRKIKFGVDFLFQFEKDFIEERNKIL